MEYRWKKYIRTFSLLFSVCILFFCYTSCPGKRKDNSNQETTPAASMPSEIIIQKITNPQEQNEKAISENQKKQSTHYGGAEEVTENKSIYEAIVQAGNPYQEGDIRHIFKTRLSELDNPLFMVVLRDDGGWIILFYSINDSGIFHNSSFSRVTMPYYEWYDGLRYKSNIPGDWVECGFVGDFNSDGKMELALFLAGGIGFFMHVYEYDSENDTFIKTFDEELNLGYKEMVQYGEAKGTKGFFLNNDILDPWHKKSFYGWDPDQRKYVFMASYLEGEEQ